MQRKNRLRTLLLYLKMYGDASLSYYDDWREAFLQSPDFEADTVNILSQGELDSIRRRIGDYDLIVTLHSTNADTLKYILPLVGMLDRRKGRLLTFVGNEVSLPGCWMSDKIALLRQLHPDFVATQLSLDAGKYLYEPVEGCSVIEVPHALNPERFTSRISQQHRRIDIGARGDRYSAVLGDDERNSILDYFATTRFDPPLKIDIQTDMFGRLGGGAWAAFLNSCKATVSTESGSYYLERDDATTREAFAYLVSQEGGAQRTYKAARTWFYRHVPAPLRVAATKLLFRLPRGTLHRVISSAKKESMPFQEVYERFFKNRRNAVSGKCVSSRHFEAAGTKTLQVMFPGRFNGIFLPDVHYVSLNHDFSNINDVLAKFCDVNFRERMTEDTYQYVLSLHTYQHRVRAIYEQVCKT